MLSNALSVTLCPAGKIEIEVEAFLNVIVLLESEVVECLSKAPTLI